VKFQIRVAEKELVWCEKGQQTSSLDYK